MIRTRSQFIIWPITFIMVNASSEHIRSHDPLFVYAAYFFVFSISFGQEVYPRKMRDKVRQQQLQLQMAQLYASDQVRYILTHPA